ncbi:MAG: lysophospholipid acyltransferase family protein [Candidatus Hydrogenedentes bacterium]|nr:lysophospholipid acyltransferase family protein [Candidatus Hydrogenedentota bacterium]
MHYTIFDTPVLTPVLRVMAHATLQLLGWRVDGLPPDEPKYVATFAPHTSNWDLPMVVLFGLVLDVKLLWMGKISLFRWPVGGFLRWLGGLPVDRGKANNTVLQAIRYIEDRERIVIGIAPEGTRSKVTEWKMGFYHIASGARVPVAPAYLDYARKCGGFGPMMIPAGNMDKEVQELRAFYSRIAGKRRHAAAIEAMGTNVHD